ncbi:MAG TPA: hypothetical protein VII99_11305 [Bacteroidia bacterium]
MNVIANELLFSFAHTKMKKYFFFSVLAAVVILSSCAPSRLVRPLEKGQKIISANLGGPLIGFSGKIIPVPLSSIMYAQGLKENTSVFGSLHTTSLLFGVIQTDIGICRRVYYNDSLRLGVSVTPALNLAIDKWEWHSKCWPQLDVNVYRECRSKKSFYYAGMENWIELAMNRADGTTQKQHWIFAPQAGFTYCRKKWNYNIEMKYIAPNISNLLSVVDYKGIGGKGAMALYFTFTRKIK